MLLEHVYLKNLIISLGWSVSWYSEKKQKAHINGVTEDYLEKCGQC